MSEVIAEIVMPNGGFLRTDPLGHYRLVGVRFGGLLSYVKPSRIASPYQGWIPASALLLVSQKNQLRVPAAVCKELGLHADKDVFICGYSRRLPRTLAYFRFGKTDRQIRRDSSLGNSIGLQEMLLLDDLAIPTKSESGSNLLLHVDPYIAAVTDADYEPAFRDAFREGRPVSPAFLLSYDGIGNLFFERVTYRAPRCDLPPRTPVPESHWQAGERGAEDRHKQAQLHGNRAPSHPPYTKL